MPLPAGMKAPAPNMVALGLTVYIANTRGLGKSSKDCQRASSKQGGSGPIKTPSGFEMLSEIIHDLATDLLVDPKAPYIHLCYIICVGMSGML